MKSSQHYTFQLIPTAFKKLAVVITLLIMDSSYIFSQAETDKLLKCTWTDQSQFNYYKKEAVFIRIKSDREYKPWARYSYQKLVLEDIENGSLVASLDKNNNVRIPLAAIDSIQLINANRKNKNNLIVLGILTALIGILAAILGGNRFLSGDTYENAGKGCITFFSGLLMSVLGLGMVILGEINHSKYEKQGPEIRLEEPGCQCEWQTKP